MTDHSDIPRPDDAPADRPEKQERQVIGGQGQEEAGIGQRLGRDPANLGDDVTDAGDLTHPTPDPGGSHI